MSGPPRTVSDAARCSDARGDAVVLVKPVEHARRVAVGSGAITDLSVLHALMNLPLGQPVPIKDLARVTRNLLEQAPAGALDWPILSGTVLRLADQPVRVPLVVVRAGTWHAGLRRAGAFAPFAKRGVVLPQRPRRLDEYALEADYWGVGLWVTSRGGELEQIVPPEPWIQRYAKPAQWRFLENAYAAWLGAGPSAAN